MKSNKEIKEPFPNKKYQIIYADPPWEFKTYSEKGRMKTPDRHYPLMKIENIKSMDTDSIADENCVLFLWVPWCNLPDALEVMKAWNFKYSCCGFIWIKKNKHSNNLFWGLGKWTRNNSEVCLLGIKGHPLKYKKSYSVHQVVISKIEEHSKKPDEVRKRIVELMGDLPRIELFARQKVEGWDCWGNEVPNETQMVLK